MAGQGMTVKRENIEACMTCPLCNNLLKEATTISICLHTFCRKCISEKLSDEEADTCPVCNVDLGCLPLEKLRPDHNLQDIRAKIFPLKRRKISAPPEVTPSSVSIPVKRKERSLSSLAISSPKVAGTTQSHLNLAGRRSKVVGRKASALRGCISGSKEPVKEEKEEAEEEEDSRGCQVNSSSPDSQNKIARPKMQVGGQESRKNQMPNHQTENDEQITAGKAELWTSLNCLVEAANRTKSGKASSEGPSLAKSEPLNQPDSKLDHKTETKVKSESRKALDNRAYMPKTRNKMELENNRNSNGTASVLGLGKRKRLRGAGCNKGPDIHDAKHGRFSNPIWFSLVASEDRKGDVSLPQISSCYLRIKDRKMPVLCIQKYLVKKLDLMSEAEVEIRCRGQPVGPTLQLENLVDEWSRAASMGKKTALAPASVGSSAKNFVMVLSYSRKTPNTP